MREIVPWLWYYADENTSYALDPFSVAMHGCVVLILMLLEFFGSQKQGMASDWCAALDRARCSCRMRPPSAQELNLKQLTGC